MTRKVPNPNTMTTRNTLTSTLGLLTASLLCTSAYAATPPSEPAAAEAVVLTGWLHVEDYTMEDVLVEWEVNGTTSTAHVSENGRFTVALPPNTEVTLRFEKPEHLTKEVVVDTRNIRDGGFSEKKHRKVSFAVIMQLERRMGGLTYPGPVGSIGFEQGGGCLAVEHNKTLVPAKQGPMVF